MIPFFCDTHLRKIVFSLSFSYSSNPLYEEIGVPLYRGILGGWIVWGFFFFFCVLKFLCDLKAGDALGTEVRGISVRRNWTPTTGSLIWCAHFDYWTYFVSLVYTVVISESVLMLCLLWVMLIWQVWCCIFLRLERSRYAFQVLVVMLLPFYF